MVVKGGMMSKDKDLSSRLLVIEEKLSFQENTIEELNRVVAEQTLEIQKLWEAKRLLQQKVIEVGATQSEADQPPPHY